MKKGLLALVVFGLLLLGPAMAGAVPYTWVDTADFNPDHYIGWWGSFSYTHNLTDNNPLPFVVGRDHIASYSLTIALYDDGGKKDCFELAFIDQPGSLGDGFYDWSYSSQTYGWSLEGKFSLIASGTIDIQIYSVWGDFYIACSKLTANGCTPVPEPATMILLGSGLLGVGLFRKGFKHK